MQIMINMLLYVYVDFYIQVNIYTCKKFKFCGIINLLVKRREVINHDTEARLC